jgi:hypothetical protein
MLILVKKYTVIITVMAMAMVTVAVTIAKTKNLKNEQKEKIVNGSN